MKLSVKIIPNAKKTEVVEWDGKILKVKIAAPAVEGKANRELIRLLSELCDCSQSEVEILKGQTSKQKILDVPVMPDL